jgi:hypothetical protein
MRKLALMAALLLAAPALGEDKPGSTGEETKEAGQAAKRDVKEGAEKTRDSMRESGQRAEERTEAAGQQAREDARTSASRAQTDQQGQQGPQTAQTGEQARDRMEKDSFDIDGKVAKVSKNSVTLNRENLPSAMLHIDGTTKIEVDGNQGRLSQLKPGQDVKASFNLKGDKAHAIEIKADTK